ncbi:MAG: hypothetical protein U0174_24200 [Polyangiaceae bacterium]
MRVEDRELIASSILWVFQIAATFGVLLWDEKRIPETSLERAWPVASRNLYAVYLGPLALLFHFWRTRAGFFFWRTRGGWKGPLYGLLSTFAVSLALEVPALVLEAVLQLGDT